MYGNILVSYRYKWEVDKVGIDNVTDDKVHCKEIGWFECVHELEGGLHIHIAILHR